MQGNFTKSNMRLHVYNTQNLYHLLVHILIANQEYLEVETLQEQNITTKDLL